MQSLRQALLVLLSSSAFLCLGSVANAQVRTRDVASLMVGGTKISIKANDQSTVLLVAETRGKFAVGAWRADDLRPWLDSASAIMRYATTVAPGETVQLSAPSDGATLYRTVGQRGSVYRLVFVSTEVIDVPVVPSELVRLFDALRRADATMRSMARTPTTSTRTPTTSIGEDCREGSLATVETDGVNFPHREYLSNVERQLSNQFRAVPDSGFRIGVAFLIRRDGSVTGVRLTSRSGTYALDAAAMDAVEAAAAWFGALPSPFSDDALPVIASFSGCGNARAVAYDQPYFEFQVEKQVQTAPASPQPRYPEVLKAARVEGEVLGQFVVGTTGRAEMSTFKVLKSSHDGFTQAVRNVLPQMRFTPAEIGGRKVKQMVQMPFTFALNR